MRNSIRYQNLKVWWAGGGIFVLGFVLTFSSGSGTPTPPSSSTRPSNISKYIPRQVHKAGQQIFMVYFGSAKCAWSNRKEMPALIERVKLGLASRADAKGWSFRTAGVALDWQPEEGIRYLDRFGQFDEISAGSAWANAAAVHYFGGQVASSVATPVILVVRRRMTLPDTTAGALNFGSEEERVLIRLTGIVEIQRWIRNGLPLPGIDSLPSNIPDLLES